MVYDCDALVFARVYFGNVLDFENGLEGFSQKWSRLKLVPVSLPQQSSPYETVYDEDRRSHHEECRVDFNSGQGG